MITIKVEKKRADRKVASREKQRAKKEQELIAFENRKANDIERRKQQLEQFRRMLGGDITYEHVLNFWLPTNIKHLLQSEHSDFYRNKLVGYGDPPKTWIQKEKILYIPEQFSLIDHAPVGYSFIQTSINELLFGNSNVSFSYKHCKHLDIGAQLVLDIIIRDVIRFLNKCVNSQLLEERWKFLRKRIGLIDANETIEDIRKILFSVGSLALHARKTIYYKDIIPYPLCSHSRENDFDPIKAIEQKELDLTQLVDYVINSLARVNRRLTDEKLDDLCKIIGEVLINAEEHSTTKNRFSIGYFQERNENGKHSGLFRLVILNFGKTIYEKFADPNCPNRIVTDKMKQLSEKYTKSGFFYKSQFEEESLWTLYALQEGVTFIPDKKRGNGSIQFIESFFSLKGDDETEEKKSRMTILSGNTKIIFDGTYRIFKKTSGVDTFQYMTFNKTNNIEDKPDDKYVQFVEHYFPGTVISARIYFDEEDLLNDAN